MAEPDPHPLLDADEDPLALVSRLQDLLEALRARLSRPCHPAAGGPCGRLLCGSIRLDLARLRVTDGGSPVALAPREVLVLAYFLERPDQVVTREQLLVHVWGYRYTGDARTVDVHVCRLRRKLPALRGRLLTLKHIGYRLAPDEEMAPRTTAPPVRREFAPGPRTSARQIVPGHAVRATRVTGS